MKVSLLPIAKAEISAAAEGYERKSPGLGHKFLDRVDQALEKIGRNPQGYQKVIGENRRCNLEKFPYALWFKIVNEVVVVGCLDSRRDPTLARERAVGVIPLPKPPEPS